MNTETTEKKPKWKKTTALVTAWYFTGFNLALNFYKFFDCSNSRFVALFGEIPDLSKNDDGRPTYKKFYFEFEGIQCFEWLLHKLLTVHKLSIQPVKTTQ